MEIIKGKKKKGYGCNLFEKFEKTIFDKKAGFKFYKVNEPKIIFSYDSNSPSFIYLTHEL